MSEYTHVEKPLLTQLEALGWQVVDHRELGIPGIPDDPSVSGRNSFREVILPKVFRDAVRRINTTEDGREWLTDEQLDQIAQELVSHPGKSLIEANQAVHEMLMKTSGGTSSMRSTGPTRHRSAPSGRRRCWCRESCPRARTW